MRAVRVLERIRESLLHDAIRREVDAGRQSGRSPSTRSVTGSPSASNCAISDRDAARPGCGASAAWAVPAVRMTPDHAPHLGQRVAADLLDGQQRFALAALIVRRAARTPDAWTTISDTECATTSCSSRAIAALALRGGTRARRSATCSARLQEPPDPRRGETTVVQTKFDSQPAEKSTIAAAPAMTARPAYDSRRVELPAGSAASSARRTAWRASSRRDRPRTRAALALGDVTGTANGWRFRRRPARPPSASRQLPAQVSIESSTSTSTAERREGEHEQLQGVSPNSSAEVVHRRQRNRMHTGIASSGVSNVSSSRGRPVNR